MPFSAPTLEQLLAAIRDPATSMDDLTHMVGPSPEEQSCHETVMSQIEQLWTRAEREQLGNDPQSWPCLLKDRYNRHTAQSQAFENRYC
jgi:hypothetical protein